MLLTEPVEQFNVKFYKVTLFSVLTSQVLSKSIHFFQNPSNFGTILIWSLFTSHRH